MLSTGRNRLRILLLLAALGLQACAGIDLDTEFSRDAAIQSQIIDQNADRFADIDPLALNDEMKAYVDAYIDSGDTQERRVEKLQDLLYNEEFLNIQYSNEKTHTAQQLFYAREGNCLSLINLYIALARYAGVEAQYQTVRVQPSWDLRGGLLVLSQHINATGRFSVQKRYVVDFTPEIALQQLTSNIISDQQARALYFNNLGVEAQVAGDSAQALAYYKNALFLDPDLSIAWNNIGATYRRLGQAQLAEYSYQMAFNADARNAASINNLAKFYRGEGRYQLAREYEEAITRFNNMNPYYHYARGNLAYAENDLETARLSYRRAIRLKEVEPDFYLALARVFSDLGYDRDAQRMRASADALVTNNAEIYRPSDQRLRIIENNSILRDSSPGLSIILN